MLSKNVSYKSCCFRCWLQLSNETLGAHTKSGGPMDAQALVTSKTANFEGDLQKIGPSETLAETTQ